MKTVLHMLKVAYALMGLQAAILLTASPTLADTGREIAGAAEERLKFNVVYDPSYRAISYPMGDVPAETGVCTDVVIRTYRKLGVDLQQLVHEDMRRAFADYPAIWGLKRPDANIDHRRVPNLERFFKRQGAALAISGNAEAYRPGDVVSWRLPDGRPHMGVVSTRRAASGRPLIVHNIGAGPELDDMLFVFDISGHFRYAGPGR